MSSEWIPVLGKSDGPRYLALVQSLENDVQAGILKPGTRLLPQRDMANQLGLSVGTVSRAYAEAEARGLISGEVGRGTFVQRRRLPASAKGAAQDTINLALNAPPSTGEDELIASVLSEILADGALTPLLGYLPHQGLAAHREIMAAWLTALGIRADVDNLFITHGGQHALSIALNMVAAPNDTVLTERFTYSGMIALSAQNGYRLHGVDGDDEGLLPDALDRAFTETGARVVFATPSLQTPIGTTMTPARRRQIADVVEKHNAYVLEDDVYAFLFASPPTPISALIASRSFYVTSFAKCLAPGLRIATMIVPERFRDRCINAVRATGWMASPIMAEVVARLIHSGDLSRQVHAKRAAAARRNEIADRLLGRWLAPIAGTPPFHRWLPIPPGRTLIALVTQAAQAGITIAPPGALQQVDRGTLGIRLCVGYPASEALLEKALSELRQILQSAEAISFV
ncbi:MAG TPA: PLP-dependent aminotransferase family protein [Bradyrhizobium sp.]|uniref:aminotransferase-like domain-containing protein n=1 Tax=Bradyrhizobium sp. TaxID=376 RepID=UPI002CAE82FA|nr:PLP-dependent aminotransferase family protein [Bradyrhizobium sp.]HLZ05333.1 PLP-dependent aminotransferase family protein [Bradyrhizobium sp.]